MSERSPYRINSAGLRAAKHMGDERTSLASQVRITKPMTDHDQQAELTCEPCGRAFPVEDLTTVGDVLFCKICLEIDLTSKDSISYVLTIPDQQVAQMAVSKSDGTDGQGDLIDSLELHPLARSERGLSRRMDHVHLGRFVGTDYCQWWGRCSDGYHRPIGRIMQIVRVSQ